MTDQEIVKILKEAANFRYADNVLFGIGAINQCDKVQNMDLRRYRERFYPRMVWLLESIPWTNIVKNPYCPLKEKEYPNEEGYYITMLNCNEHEVLINKLTKNNRGEFRFTLYDSTHIKWWLPLTEGLKQEIIKQCEVKNEVK